MLIALLQRTPVLRMLAAAESVWVSSSLGQVLKASAVVAGMLGAVDTLAGATGFATSPGSPVEAAVGTAFSAAFAYTGGPTTVGSYAISNLPPGLSVPNSQLVSGGILVLNASSGTITGTPTQAGEFSVGITAYDDPNRGEGAHGHASTTYMITVFSADVAPAITSQPASITVTAGQAASFTVATTGSQAPTYQWTRGGVNIVGATSAIYTIAATTSSDAGTYSVVVANSVGSVTSNGAMLTVNAASAAPLVTTEPLSQTVVAGNTVIFTAAASGSPAPTFQWQKNGVNIAGATNSSVAINSVAENDSGSYRLVATNDSGTAVSNVATLTVIVIPSNAVVSITVE